MKGKQLHEMDTSSYLDSVATSITNLSPCKGIIKKQGHKREMYTYFKNVFQLL